MESLNLRRETVMSLRIKDTCLCKDDNGVLLKETIGLLRFPGLWILGKP